MVKCIFIMYYIGMDSRLCDNDVNISVLIKYYNLNADKMPNLNVNARQIHDLLSD